MRPSNYLQCIRVVLLFALLLGNLTGYTQTCYYFPTTASASGCSGQNYTLYATSYSTNVTTHKWYTTQTGSTQVSGVTVSNPGYGAVQSTYTSNFTANVTYWVASVCSGGVESGRVPVSFTLVTPTTVTYSASINPLEVNLSNNLTLTASGCSNCYWRYGISTSNPILNGSNFTPTRGGTYYLQGTNSCGTVQNHTINVNYLPVADAGPDHSIGLPSSYTIYGSGSDPDGDAITYSWTKQSGPAVTLGATNQSFLSLSGITAGTYVFRLTVTDSPHGKTSFDEVTVVASSASNNYNMVRSETVKVPNKFTNGEVHALGINEKSSQITYMDGLGNTTQTLDFQASVTNKDQLLVYEYDELGRQKKSYLPASTNQSTGNFISNGITAQYNFYNDVGFSDPNEFVIDDTRPFSEQTFEPSPLGRVLTSRGPGSAWSSIASSVAYGTNSAGEVRFYTVGTTGNPSYGGYPANVLSVTTMTDEQGIQSKSYYNRDGLKILEKRQADATQWAETYYVYDVYNNLRFIIPPELVKGNPSVENFDAWTYQMVYDNLNRVVETKGPGTEWTYKIYDDRNRLVLSQDGKQRLANEWSYTKYDGLDRPRESGLYRPGSAISRATMQANVDAHNQVNPSSINIIVSSYTGTNTYVASNSITLQPGFTFNASTNGSFSASIRDPYGDNYKSSFPTENYEEMVISYYDNYSSADCSICTDVNFQFVNESWGALTSNEPFVKSDRVRGLTVGGSVKILGTNQWLHSVSYYNKWGAVIQTISSNHLGGRTRSSSLIDFTGKPLAAWQTHIGFGPITTIKRRFTYDHADRLINTYHQVNTQPEVLLSSNQYNEIDQLVDKKIHSTDNGATFLQSIDYRYAIRGWMTRMNSTAGTDAGDPTDYFAMELAYNNSFGALNTPRNDGFITGAKWRSSLSSKEQGYGYSYNNLGWLTGASFKQNESNNWASQNTFFNEDGITYDFNGNIQSLTRKQQKTPTTSVVIDQLAYNYGTAGGNRLFKVTDSAPAADKAKGFDDQNTVNDDYVYDVNGNLIQDLNKGITAITYNTFNLTDRVTFSNNSYLQYTYDAGGTKLQQTYNYTNAQGPQQIKTDYVDEFVFLNDQLSLVFHEEGRLVAPDYTNLIANPTRDANGLEGYTAEQNVTLTNELVSSQNYVKVVSNQATSIPGAFPIGGGAAGVFNVKPNETYLLQVLGYQSVGTSAKLYVWSNIGDLVWASAPALPVGAANENWSGSTFTVPAGVTQIKVGVRFGTPAIGHTFYINRVALYKTDWEYQYFLSDQVGSPRVVLGTSANTLTFKATMETKNHATENNQFLNLNSARYSINPTANQTPGGNEAITMNNAYRIGPARSFKVMPGDNINASVYAYWTTSSGLTQTPFSTMAAALVTTMAGGVTPVIDGINAAYTNTTNAAPGFLLAPFQGSTKPSAFINYILFDESFKPVEAKSTPVGSTAGVKQLIALPAIAVQQTGYLFVYLSYDNESTQLVYFDDLTIAVTESPVVQVNNYYPYGLTALEWVRDGEVDNNFLFQGKEYNDSTGWHNFGARMYAGDLGRWFATDPEKQFASPFNAMGNNPVMGIDPDGEFVHMIIGAVIGGGSSYIGGRAAGLRGFELFATSLMGAGIGAISGGVGSSVGSSVLAAGGSSVLSGAAGGVSAGAVGGFYGAGANGGNPLEGGWKGAVSGLVGGTLGSSFSGGFGAFLGGASSGATSAALNDGDVLRSALIGGGISFGLYHTNSLIRFSRKTGIKEYDQLKIGDKYKLNRILQSTLAVDRERGFIIDENGNSGDILTKGEAYEGMSRKVFTFRKLLRSGKFDFTRPSLKRYHTIYDRNSVEFRSVINDARVVIHTHRGLGNTNFSDATGDLGVMMRYQNISAEIMLNGTEIHFMTRDGNDQMIGLVQRYLVRNQFGF